MEAANNLAMNVGGDLLLESLQNTSKERSFSLGGGYGTMGGGRSYSANVGYSKGDRAWVDNQTSLIGGNSVDIMVGKNTNIKGAIIANKKADGTDGANLSLTTDTLTYSNIQDKDKARNFSLSGSYSKKGGKSNTSGSVGYSMHDKTQDTNATIGLGDIIVGGINTNSDSSLVSGLNRDISRAQVITKDLSVSPIEVSATIRRDDIKGFENPITSKINEWKEIVKNPLKPFEDNFNGVLSDVSSITKDLRQSDHSELADGIDRFVVNSGKEYWNAKDRTHDAISAIVSASYDNIIGNGSGSSIMGLYGENTIITKGITSAQRNREKTNITNSLTKQTPEGVVNNFEFLLDNHSQYNENAHKGDVIIFQDGSLNSPDAFAYKNDINTININIKKIDLANPGEVVNKLYHEAYNFYLHSGGEGSAERYGNYAESRWNDLGERNGYQNNNIITSSQWNQKYTAQNNATIAIGNTISAIQYNYDRKNTNSFVCGGLCILGAATIGSILTYQGDGNPAKGINKNYDTIEAGAGMLLDGVKTLDPNLTNGIENFENIVPTAINLVDLGLSNGFDTNSETPLRDILINVSESVENSPEWIRAGLRTGSYVLGGKAVFSGVKKSVSVNSGIVGRGDDISLTTEILKPDFYTGVSGVTIPSTGYRAIGGPNVKRAVEGDLMSRKVTYFTFDDISGMSPDQVKSFLQLEQSPTHYSSFNTLHQFDNISIPREKWNKGLKPEPITKSFPEFGRGGATQVITTKPIENFTLKPLE